MKLKLKHFNSVRQVAHFAQAELYATLDDDANDSSNGEAMCAELHDKASDVEAGLEVAIQIFSVARLLAQQGLFDQRGSDSQQLAELKKAMADLVSTL